MARQIWGISLSPKWLEHAPTGTKRLSLVRDWTLFYLYFIRQFLHMHWQYTVHKCRSLNIVLAINNNLINSFGAIVQFYTHLRHLEEALGSVVHFNTQTTRYKMHKMNASYFLFVLSMDMCRAVLTLLKKGFIEQILYCFQRTLGTLILTLPESPTCPLS